jgi:hypothetical protein
MGEVYCGVEQEKGRRGEDTKQKTQNSRHKTADTKHRMGNIGWET